MPSDKNFDQIELTSFSFESQEIQEEYLDETSNGFQTLEKNRKKSYISFVISIATSITDVATIKVVTDVAIILMSGTATIFFMLGLYYATKKCFKRIQGQGNSSKTKEIKKYGEEYDQSQSSQSLLSVTYIDPDASFNVVDDSDSSVGAIEDNEQSVTVMNKGESMLDKVQKTVVVSERPNDYKRKAYLSLSGGIVLSLAAGFSINALSGRTAGVISGVIIFLPFLWVGLDYMFDFEKKLFKCSSSSSKSFSNNIDVDKSSFFVDEISLNRSYDSSVSMTRLKCDESKNKETDRKNDDTLKVCMRKMNN